MNRSTENREDKSVLALLYGNHRMTYPNIAISVQREVEDVYQQLYGYIPENIQEIATVVMGICDDKSRFAYEEGVKCGVRLAIDLQLESMMEGGD